MSLSLSFSEVFAVPGANNIIDAVNPSTGLSSCMGETLEQIKLRYPDAVQVSYEAWKADAVARQQTPISWLCSTKQQYWYALEVLPPAAQTGNAFLVGEPIDSCHATGRPRFEAYDKRGSRYFVASRPMTIPEFSMVAAKWGGQ